MIDLKESFIGKVVYFVRKGSSVEYVRVLESGKILSADNQTVTILSRWNTNRFTTNIYFRPIAQIYSDWEEANKHLNDSENNFPVSE